MPNRRTFLTGGSVVLTAGLAGCTGILQSDDGDDTVGEGDDPDGGSEASDDTTGGDQANDDAGETEDTGDDSRVDIEQAELTRWVPASMDEYSNTLDIAVGRPSTLAEKADLGLSPMRERMNFHGHGPDGGAVDYFFDVRFEERDEDGSAGMFPLHLSVLIGDFDDAAAREWVEFEYDVELEAVEEHGEFTRYAGEAVADSENVVFSPFASRKPWTAITNPDVSGVGIADGIVVLAADRQLFKDAVDAYNGDAPRLAEAYDDFDTIVNEVSDLEYVEGVVVFDDEAPAVSDVTSVGGAWGFEFDDGEYTVHSVVLVDEADATEELKRELIEAWEEDGVQSDGEIDGRSIRISSSVDRELIVDEFWPDHAPNPKFGVDVDFGDQWIEITHRGGDTFRAGDVEVYISGSDWRLRQHWHEFDSEVDADSIVAAGDGIVIDQDALQWRVLSSDYEIRLQWEAEEGSYITIEWVFGPDG